MHGPHDLDSVNLYVTQATSGAYILTSDAKTAHYVGRSDVDLAQEIKASARKGKYTHFWFEYTTSPMRAFKLECEWYHKYAPPDNSIHPAVPWGANWRCPVQGCPWS